MATAPGCQVSYTSIQSIYDCSSNFYSTLMRGAECQSEDQVVGYFNVRVCPQGLTALKLTGDPSDDDAGPVSVGDGSNSSSYGGSGVSGLT